jgi:hypothetical protein
MSYKQAVESLQRLSVLLTGVQEAAVAMSKVDSLELHLTELEGQVAERLATLTRAREDVARAETKYKALHAEGAQLIADAQNDAVRIVAAAKAEASAEKDDAKRAVAAIRAKAAEEANAADFKQRERIMALGEEANAAEKRALDAAAAVTVAHDELIEINSKVAAAREAAAKILGG